MMDTVLSLEEVKDEAALSETVAEITKDAAKSTCVSSMDNLPSEMFGDIINCEVQHERGDGENGRATEQLAMKKLEHKELEDKLESIQSEVRRIWTELGKVKTGVDTNVSESHSVKSDVISVRGELSTFKQAFLTLADRINKQKEGCGEHCQKEAAATSSMASGGRSLSETVMEELSCPICADLYISPVTIACSHTFCKWCLHEWMASGMRQSGTCPQCRVPIACVRDTLCLDNFIQELVNATYTATNTAASNAATPVLSEQVRNKWKAEKDRRQLLTATTTANLAEHSRTSSLTEVYVDELSDFESLPSLDVMPEDYGLDYGLWIHADSHSPGEATEMIEGISNIEREGPTYIAESALEHYLDATEDEDAIESDSADDMTFRAITIDRGLSPIVGLDAAVAISIEDDEEDSHLCEEDSWSSLCEVCEISDIANCSRYISEPVIDTLLHSPGAVFNSAARYSSSVPLLHCEHLSSHASLDNSDDDINCTNSSPNGRWWEDRDRFTEVDSSYTDENLLWRDEWRGLADDEEEEWDYADEWSTVSSGHQPPMQTSTSVVRREPGRVDLRHGYLRAPHAISPRQ